MLSEIELLRSCVRNFPQLFLINCVNCPNMLTPSLTDDDWFAAVCDLRVTWVIGWAPTRSNVSQRRDKVSQVFFPSSVQFSCSHRMCAWWTEPKEREAAPKQSQFHSQFYSSYSFSRSLTNESTRPDIRFEHREISFPRIIFCHPFFSHQ